MSFLMAARSVSIRKLMLMIKNESFGPSPSCLSHWHYYQCCIILCNMITYHSLNIIHFLCFAVSCTHTSCIANNKMISPMIEKHKLYKLNT